jgi:hypothetical protein
MRSGLLLLSLFLVLSHQNVRSLFVQKPCCSAFPHSGASFGPKLPWTSPGVFGVLSKGTDKDCSGAVAGTVVLMDRGLESFVDTVKACQAKGAVAVVVRNVLGSGEGPNDLITMGSAHKDSSVHVSSIFVSSRTGDDLETLFATNPTVFVELFAADDVNSLMAYVAYLVMSVESLFFVLLSLLIMVFVWTRRALHSERRKCRCCRQRHHRTALIVADSDMLQPLQTQLLSDSNRLLDPESKPPGERAASSVIVLPVVYNNGGQVEHSVHINADPTNLEPVFEQQEQ